MLWDDSGSDVLETKSPRKREVVEGPSQGPFLIFSWWLSWQVRKIVRPQTVSPPDQRWERRSVV